MPCISMRYPEGKEKALTFSYDDGVYSDIRFAEIMDRYGLRATFNINGGLFCREDEVTDSPTRRLTKKEAYALYANTSHEVALHGYWHQHVKDLPAAGVTYEYTKDREVLENMFSRVVRGMAYPYGDFSDEVVRVVRDCGIAYGRTTRSTEGFGLPKEWLLLDPTCHHRNPRLMELAESFNEKTLRPLDNPLLFYVWGHTYEFVHSDNWDVIENFAKAVSGKPDVWYATNIEIFEYVEAYKRLRFSVDASIVTNPTTTTLWFVSAWEGKTYRLNPGETLCLPKE